MDIHQKLQARETWRWGIVDTIKHQNLAEHSFNVAMIAMEMAGYLDLSQATVGFRALCHDLNEIDVGDIPSPTKEKLGINGEWPAHDDHISWVVKVADLIEAAWFIKYNRYTRRGDLAYENCEERLWRAIACSPPELNKVFSAMANMLLA